MVSTDEPRWLKLCAIAIMGARSIMVKMFFFIFRGLGIKSLEFRV
jgi:hypothetical protein